MSEETKKQENPQETAAPETAQPETPQGDNGGNDNKLFTQDEVNSFVGERAKRAAEAAKAKLLEELGLADVEALKTLVDSERKRKEAEMSEVEKAQAVIEQERKRAAELQQQIESMKAQQQKQAIATAVVNAARDAGAYDASDVLANLLMTEALDSVVDSEGKLNEDAVKKAVADMQAKKPHLFTANVPSIPSNRNGRAPQPSDKLKQRAQIEINKRHGRW